MTIDQLNTKQDLLSVAVNELISVKKKLFSNVDIESPMCAFEKDLTRSIANLFSQINAITVMKRKIKNA